MIAVGCACTINDVAHGCSLFRQVETLYEQSQREREIDVILNVPLLLTWVMLSLTMLIKVALSIKHNSNILTPVIVGGRASLYQDRSLRKSRNFIK